MVLGRLEKRGFKANLKNSSLLCRRKLNIWDTYSHEQESNPNQKSRSYAEIAATQELEANQVISWYGELLQRYVGKDKPHPCSSK